MAIVFAQIPFDIFDLRFSELRALEVTLRENFNFNDSGIRFTDAVVLDDGEVFVAFGGEDLGLNPISGEVTALVVGSLTSDDEIFGISGFSVPSTQIANAIETDDVADDMVLWARVFRDADNVFLSAFDDVAFFGRGDDFIRGFGGDDMLWGEAGNDIMLGGGGDDELSGGGGRDFMRGGAGDDTLEGGGNDDNLAGQAGDDSLNGQQGNDFLNGNGGDDTIVGAGGKDILVGGGGNDDLTGGGNDDRLIGGPGDDVLKGQIGRDDLSGGGGDDRLFGGLGVDRLDGGGGNDVLTGGPGADVFVFRKRYADDEIVDFQLGQDRLALDPALWGGGLTLKEVVEQFGFVSQAGVGADPVFSLNFGSDTVRFTGLNVDGLTPGGLADSLVLFGDL